MKTLLTILAIFLTGSTFAQEYETIQDFRKSTVSGCILSLEMAASAMETCDINMNKMGGRMNLSMD